MVCVCVRVCEETLSRSVSCLTHISRRPACAFLSMAKRGLRAPLLIFPPLLAVPLTSSLLHLVSVNHQTCTSLYTLLFYLFLLLSGSESDSLSSVSWCVCVELWKDNRHVMGEMCGGGCAHLRVCTYAHKTKATVHTGYGIHKDDAKMGFGSLIVELALYNSAAS